MADNSVEITKPLEGDGHYRAKGFEWLLLCPHMGSSEKIALMLLCGLAREGHQRNLTLEEIGDFLIKGPVEIGEAPKRMSVSGVAKVLNHLSDLGQLTDPQGEPIRVSNRMVNVLRLVPYRRPRHTCEASRNVYDALARLRDEEPEWPLATDDAHESERAARTAYKNRRPSDDAHKSVPDAQNSVREAHKSVRNAQNSVQDRPLTCENGPFPGFALDSSSSSLPHAQERGEDATPEAPLEEDEEMKGNDDNPSAEPRAHLPQEREGGEKESFADNEPQELPDGLVDIPGWLATLPGLGGAQAPASGFLEYPVMRALDAGWTLEALAAHLKPLVDPSKARSRSAIPGWYDKHLGELPEAPRSAKPLCDNPAHARTRVEDTDGGCLMCNSAPKAGTTVKTEPVIETTDAATAAALCRQALSSRFQGSERSRNQMPHHRAKDEADRNRTKANDLLRGESGR